MNKILIIIFTTICLNSYSQNITLDQLIILRGKSISDIEDFLSNKNWQLFHITRPENGKLGAAHFAYNKQLRNDRAESFIAYYYPSQYEKIVSSRTSNRITIQIMHLAVYNTFLTRIKELGYKQVSSQINDGSIEKVYSGNINTIKVVTQIKKGNNPSLDAGTVTAYFITIISTKEYREQIRRDEEATKIIEEAAAVVDSAAIILERRGKAY